MAEGDRERERECGREKKSVGERGRERAEEVESVRGR